MTTETQHSPTDDVLVELVKDHREVEEVFTALERGGQSPQERHALVEQVIRELVRHSEAEELHLYPLVAKRLDGGEKMAQLEVADHARVEELMKELERAEPTAPEYEPLIRRLVTEVRTHVEEEEAALFPALRERCTPEELREVGDRVRATKRVSPTHPHPSAPNNPAVRAVLSPLTGLVDRTRDALRGDRG